MSLLARRRLFAPASGGGTAYHDAVAVDNPVLWLRFGENVSGNPVNAGSATLTGSSYNSGARGQATLCGDTSDYSVGITSGGGVVGPTVSYAAGAIGKASGFSIEALIYPTDLSAHRAIWSGGSSNNAAELRIISGKVNLIRRGVAVVAIASTTLSVNTRYHIGCKVDGSGVYTFFLNGAVDGTGAGSTAFSATATGGFVGYENLSASPFVGRIDEVCVYHSALADARFAAHAAAAGLGGGGGS